MYAYHVRAQCLCRPEDNVEVLRLELQVIVRFHEDAGKQTYGFYRNRKSIPKSSLQPLILHLLQCHIPFGFSYMDTLIVCLCISVPFLLGSYDG